MLSNIPKASSETQGQIVGARESLNGRKNMARRKVKNGEKSPWGQVLPYQFQTVAAVLTSDGFLAPIRTQNGGDRLELVWPVRHCPQALFSPFYTFLRAIFFLPFTLSLASTICPWVTEVSAKRAVCFSVSWGIGYFRLINQMMTAQVDAIASNWKCET